MTKSGTSQMLRRRAKQVGIASKPLADFLIGPDVERPLALVPRARLLGGHAVGILGGIEAAGGVFQIAPHVLERVDRDIRVEAIAGELRGFAVGEHELRLVVEHLLEVRHTPLGVD